MQAQKWNNSRIRHAIIRHGGESCGLSARAFFSLSLSLSVSLSILYRLPFSILQPSFPFCCRHNLNLCRPDDTRETYVHRCHSILSPPPSSSSRSLFLSSVSSHTQPLFPSKTILLPLLFFFLLSPEFFFLPFQILFVPSLSPDPCSLNCIVSRRGEW